MSSFEFQPGVTYIVKKTFVDFDGYEVKAGEQLTFMDQSFFPYDDGHTYTFKQRTIRLRGVDEPSITDHLEDYFQLLPQDTWSD